MLLTAVRTLCARAISPAGCSQPLRVELFRYTTLASMARLCPATMQTNLNHQSNQTKRRYATNNRGRINTGVKGIKGRKFTSVDTDRAAAGSDDDDDDDDDDNAASENTETEPEKVNIEDQQYEDVANATMHVTRHQCDQHVYVVQPYVKWGPRQAATTPDLQLQEAAALVRSLPGWHISRSIAVPLDSLAKKHLFGTGKLQEIRMNIQHLRSTGTPVSCMFVSKGQLSGSQKRFLQKFFGLPVMDRYSMVIQILRLHATSTEAKLQVAAAEIPYIWSQMRDASSSLGPGAAATKATHTLNDKQKEMLRVRERKLRTELKNVRSHREVLRNRRRQMNFPIVAVVGYTNAGKTSLIQALTSDADMQPRDQLFATLDVTAHAGLLPSKLKVIYMDTVGFMADLPTELIECFVATLEDAMLADIVVHVQDISHPNRAEQSKHVEGTLRSLLANVLDTREDAKHSLRYNPLDRVIQAGNKADLLAPGNVGKEDDRSEADDSSSSAPLLISSKTGVGIEELRARIETELLRATQRKRITIKVPMGGPEASWLYKNAAVTEAAADPQNAQNLMLSVVIAESELKKFRYRFVENNNARS